MDTKERFTNRVADYARYRPAYPAESIDWLVRNVPITTNSKIADIGAGTGIFTEALLTTLCSVVAVEPNEAMRVEANSRLGGFDKYRGVAGSAESTMLDSASIDLVTAAQAFHWFDLQRTKAEFDRILRPEGKVLLIWNRRSSDDSAFLAQYEEMLSSYIPEYKKVSHANASDEVIKEFLGSGMVTANFSHHQSFDLDGLKGRLQSSSYCPVEGTDAHRVVMEQLVALYEQHANEQGIRFDYSTQLYLG